MNPNYFRIAMPVLFLPFKLKANTTVDSQPLNP